MMAEGGTTAAYVLSVPLPQLPPLPPGLEIRVRNVFPYDGRDLLDTVVFVAPVDLPIGVFDPEQAPEAVISRFITRIDRIVRVEESELDEADRKQAVERIVNLRHEPFHTPDVGNARLVIGELGGAAGRLHTAQFSTVEQR